MMKRYDRIGVGKHWYDVVARNIAMIQTFDANACPLETRGVALSYQSDCQGLIAFGYYLNEELDEAKTWGRRLINTADEDFNGKWRKQVTGRDADYWANGGGDWTATYRNALAFALALDDFDAAKRLSRFPPIAKPDGTSFKKRREWYVVVALVIAAPKSSEVQVALKAALSSKDKATALYSECLKFILAKDSAAASAAFDSCMAHYQKQDKKLDEFSVKLAADASILAHIARRNKVSLETKKWDDYLIEFKDYAGGTPS